MSVYFIQCGGAWGPIKIGTTEGNPRARLAAMQTGNPQDLRLLHAIPGGQDTESGLHNMFAHLRIRGEWFRGDDELRGFIAGLQYAEYAQLPSVAEAISKEACSESGASAPPDSPEGEAR